jgi:hypothetical protein
LLKLRGTASRQTNLIIAPDDTLWDRRLARDRANRFLIEEAATMRHRNSAARDDEATAESGRRWCSTTLLALGNPLLGGGSRYLAPTLREKSRPLPEAEQEVKALRQLYGMSRSKVHIGADAREDVKVKRQARILHFAARDAQ